MGSEMCIRDRFSESLGAEDSDGSTYLQMIETNASLIADALSG